MPIHEPAFETSAAPAINRVRPNTVGAPEVRGSLRTKKGWLLKAGPRRAAATPPPHRWSLLEVVNLPAAVPISPSVGISHRGSASFACKPLGKSRIVPHRGNRREEPTGVGNSRHPTRRPTTSVMSSRL